MTFLHKKMSHQMVRHFPYYIASLANISALQYQQQELQLVELQL
jgi:hypothetical protein